MQIIRKFDVIKKCIFSYFGVVLASFVFLTGVMGAPLDIPKIALPKTKQRSKDECGKRTIGKGAGLTFPSAKASSKILLSNLNFFSANSPILLGKIPSFFSGPMFDEQEVDNATEVLPFSGMNLAAQGSLSDMQNKPHPKLKTAKSLAKDLKINTLHQGRSSLTGSFPGASNSSATEAPTDFPETIPTHQEYAPIAAPSTALTPSTVPTPTPISPTVALSTVAPNPTPAPSMVLTPSTVPTPTPISPTVVLSTAAPNPTPAPSMVLTPSTIPTPTPISPTVVLSTAAPNPTPAPSIVSTSNPAFMFTALPLSSNTSVVPSSSSMIAPIVSKQTVINPTRLTSFSMDPGVLAAVPFSASSYTQDLINVKLQDAGFTLDTSAKIQQGKVTNIIVEEQIPSSSELTLSLGKFGASSLNASFGEPLKSSASHSLAIKTNPIEWAHQPSGVDENSQLFAKGKASTSKEIKDNKQGRTKKQTISQKTLEQDKLWLNSIITFLTSFHQVLEGEKIFFKSTPNNFAKIDKKLENIEHDFDVEQMHVTDLVNSLQHIGQSFKQQILSYESLLDELDQNINNEDTNLKQLKSEIKEASEIYETLKIKQKEAQDNFNIQYQNIINDLNYQINTSFIKASHWKDIQNLLQKDKNFSLDSASLDSDVKNMLFRLISPNLEKKEEVWEAIGGLLASAYPEVQRNEYTENFIRLLSSIPGEDIIPDKLENVLAGPTEVIKHSFSEVYQGSKVWEKIRDAVFQHLNIEIDPSLENGAAKIVNGILGLKGGSLETWNALMSQFPDEVLSQELTYAFPPLLYSHNQLEGLKAEVQKAEQVEKTLAKKLSQSPTSAKFFIQKETTEKLYNSTLEQRNNSIKQLDLLNEIIKSPLSLKAIPDNALLSPDLVKVLNTLVHHNQAISAKKQELTNIKSELDDLHEKFENSTRLSRLLLQKQKQTEPENIEMKFSTDISLKNIKEYFSILKQNFDDSSAALSPVLKDTGKLLHMAQRQQEVLEHSFESKEKANKSLSTLKGKLEKDELMQNLFPGWHESPPSLPRSLSTKQMDEREL